MGSEENGVEMKKPTTVKKQVEILKSRNLYVENSEYAENFCEELNIIA
ncbi:hypothetical protein [Desertibacillus haloalkaliphilus]|nr:hypothetical protein [Desertibacillus haloalkaliphilus]MBU8908262.1 hypothetical protein [Desertibacillus haloalkaliphilus]